MILDKLGEFADATALNTTGTGTKVVGNLIDLTVARDIGSGEPLYLEISVDTAIGSTGSATLAFKLVSDGTTAISTTGGASEHIVTPVLAKTVYAAGYRQIYALPLEGVDYERYLALLSVVGTAKLNAGKVNAFLTKDPRKLEYYADAIPTPTT